jgi:hypothetical protein
VAKELTPPTSELERDQCDMAVTLDQKPYTVNEKPYTVNRFANSQIIAPFDKIKSLGRDLDPGPLPYQGNALPG